MREEATELGFVYNRRGCSCSGSPYIYKAEKNGKRYELTIYENRRLWKLTQNNTTIADGNAANLKTKIQALWES